MLKYEAGKPKLTAHYFLIAILRLDTNKQLFIDELLKVLATASKNEILIVKDIYETYRLNFYSKRKLKKTRDWYSVALGIHELSQMMQLNEFTNIEKFCDSKNKQLRIEAQYGMVALFKYAGLVFLDKAVFIISEWQQIRILNYLKNYSISDQTITKIDEWLRSNNYSVVLFALKLIIEHRLDQYEEAVVSIYRNTVRHAIKKQAILTIGEIKSPSSMSHLMNIYSNEEFENKCLILDLMIKIADSNAVFFLESILEHESNNFIKLKVAFVLILVSREFEEKIRDLASKNMEPWPRIYEHIKHYL